MCRCCVTGLFKHLQDRGENFSHAGRVFLVCTPSAFVLSFATTKSNVRFVNAIKLESLGRYNMKHSRKLILNRAFPRLVALLFTSLSCVSATASADEPAFFGDCALQSRHYSPQPGNTCGYCGARLIANDSGGNMATLAFLGDALGGKACGFEIGCFCNSVGGLAHVNQV